MEPQDIRRTDRVSISIPIEVLGREVTGELFDEKARTIRVGRHGAAVLLKRKLAPEQEITIRCVPTGREADARVVGQVAEQSEGYVYGLAFLDVNVNLWDIHFPEKSESEMAAGHVLLECGACRTREVACLNELELEVFSGNRSLSRACGRCREHTLWKEAVHETGPGQEQAALLRPVVEVPEPPPGPPPRTENERKYVRLNAKMKACVHQAFLGEEVVNTENVSRGGLSFKSQRIYFAGSRVDVAVPYSEGGANIFIPGRIVRILDLRAEGVNQYGVEYIKSGKSTERT